MRSEHEYRTQRKKTRLPIKLRTEEDEVIDVTLRDISVDGARIEVSEPILAGSAVSVEIGPATLPALVHWSRKGSAGLRFMERPDHGVLTLIPEG